MIETINN